MTPTGIELESTAPFRLLPLPTLDQSCAGIRSLLRSIREWSWLVHTTS
jgi:hypothetical protein